MGETTRQTGARARRIGLIVLAGVVVLGLVAAAVVALVLRPASGIAAALEDEDFGYCLELWTTPADEVAVDGEGPWSQEQETEFWSHPVALHCAVTELGEERRVRALATAFPALDGDRPGDPDEQWQPVADYVVWLDGQEVPSGEALLRVASLVRGLWVAHVDSGRYADGFTNSAVLADMRVRGELPDYDDWAATTDADGQSADGSAENDVNALFDYRNAVLEKAGDETETAYRAYTDRSRALYDVVR
ncbi:hypothetical protein [Herbiconiux sp. A18JL235]|uniref:Uncharacterized protein n=1 Tax=Herbiconiux sp. A18JL235 TaxID=3152363 RepID=A0AB39BGE6_9MICO